MLLLTTMACSGADEVDGWQPGARVGAVENFASSNELGMITGIAIGSDGMVYVADFQAGVLAYFADGSSAFGITQRGAGPGDLMMPCCVTIGNDGQLWVSDVGNRRYSIFDIRGNQAFFRTTIPSGGTGIFSAERLQRYEPGGIYHLATVQSGDNRGAPVILAIDSLGGIQSADTLSNPLLESSVLEVRIEIPGGTTSNKLAAPFGAATLLAVGEGFYARAISDKYHVEILPIGGGPATVLERPVGQIPISTREADSASALVTEWVRFVGGNLTDLNWQMAASKPVLRSLGVDHDGRLWVQRSAPDGSPSVADLFTRDGVYLETREWPNDVQMISWASRGDIAIGVRSAPSGEVSLVRLSF